MGRVLQFCQRMLTIENPYIPPTVLVVGVGLEQATAVVEELFNAGYRVAVTDPDPDVAGAIHRVIHERSGSRARYLAVPWGQAHRTQCQLAISLSNQPVSELRSQFGLPEELACVDPVLYDVPAILLATEPAKA